MFPVSHIIIGIPETHKRLTQPTAEALCQCCLDTHTLQKYYFNPAIKGKRACI